MNKIKLIYSVVGITICAFLISFYIPQIKKYLEIFRVKIRHEKSISYLKSIGHAHETNGFRVHLKDIEINKELSEKLLNVQGLTLLDLTKCNIKINAVPVHGNVLQELNLDGSKFSTLFFKDIARFSKISTLTLMGTNINDEMLLNWKPINNIGLLNLAGTDITDKIFESFNANPDIYWLDLSHCNVGSDRKRFSKIKTLKKLSLLILANSQISDTTIELLNSNINIEYLNIDNTNITEKGIRMVSGLKNLERLSIANTLVSNEWTNVFEKNRRLEFIDISNTEITENDLMILVKELLKIAEHKITIDVSNTKVSDEEIKNINQLYKNIHIKSNISGAVHY